MDAKKKKAKSIESTKWFEEHYTIVIFKAILIASAVVFIIEPLFYEKVVKGNNYKFMNEGSLALCVYFTSISIAVCLFGYIHSQIKTAQISLLDIVITFMGLYFIFLGYIKFEQYPSNLMFPTYIQVALFAWILGSFFLNSILISPYNKITKWIKQKKHNLKIQEPNPKEAKFITIESPPIIIDLNIQDIATEERPVEVIDKEGLNFLPLAKTILDAINNFPADKSITIGMNGEWGSGKSSLLDLIKYQANLSSSKIHIVDFKPWIYPDENSLLHSFFKIWKNEVNDIAVQLAFEDYAQYITGIQYSSSKWDLFNLLRKKDSLKETKKIITNYLETTNEKFLIIIDDLDRVEANEILEVAKLTRAIADFPNTVYLLAYDRNYIDSLLVQKIDSIKGTNFFDKIITLEYRIPKLDSKRIESQLLLLLNLNMNFIKQYNPSFEYNIIKKLIDEIAAKVDLIDYLPTLRDLKRFLNALLLRFNSLSQVHRVDFCDIFILELTFYKYRNAYDKFYENKPTIISSLQRNDTQNAIMEEFSIKSSSILFFLSEGKKPNQIDNLIDIYFSYLNNNSFSSNDIDLIFATKDNEELIEFYINENLTESLLIGIFNRFGSFNGGFGPMESAGFYRIINTIQKHASKGSILNDEAIFNITESQINSWISLEKQKFSSSRSEILSIDRLREGILGFEYSFPIYDFEKDEKDLIFHSVKYSFNNSRLIDDDSTYNKVFNINNVKYQFTFDLPTVQHWRLGFKLSESEYFPISIPMRLFLNFPLFHLGRSITRNDFKDTDNVLATYYPNDVVVGEESKEDQVYDIKFKPIQSIKMRVGNTIKGVVINIFSDGNLIYDIVLADTQKYTFLKLYAWGDNDTDNNATPYEVRLNIKLEKRYLE